jgi:hypothetical protein
MIRDLRQVFDEHEWSGQPIGLAQANASAGGPSADEDDPSDCPEGTTPQTVTYRLPNGEEVTKIICS